MSVTFISACYGQAGDERGRGSLSWIKVDPEMNEKFMEGGLMKGCQTCEKVRENHWHTWDQGKVYKIVDDVDDEF